MKLHSPEEHRKVWSDACLDRAKSLPVPETDEDLAIIARALSGLRHLSADETKTEYFCLINELLQLQAYLLSPILRRFLYDEFEEIDRASSGRPLLRGALAAALAGLLPAARDGRDIVLVPLPSGLASDTMRALDALEFGETQPIVAPRMTGKHGDAYTWADGRLRAVEFIHYFVGMGYQIGKARNRVASALGVGVETIRRDWEREAKGSDAILQAEQAGKLQATVDDGGDIPEPIDAHVHAAWESFQRQPLKDFAEAWKAAPEIKSRYWGKSKSEIPHLTAGLQPRSPAFYPYISNG